MVLGGFDPLRKTNYTDASLATGPKGRSVTAEIHKLGEKSGAISAKATASHVVAQSSFEAELMGTSTALKTMARIGNLLDSLPIDYIKPGTLWGDNEAQIKFVTGEGSAKGVRHMEMRMWYIRGEYAKGNVDLKHMAGTDLPADKITKLGNALEHKRFSRKVLDLDLVDPDYLS